MPNIQSSIMKKLYGHDIWEGFDSDPNAEVQGWNGEHPSLGMLAGLPGEKIVIDVGVWKGQSTINMALAMKNSGVDGCIIAVDTFLGSPEHWSMTDLFVRKNGMPNLYLTFMSNVKKAGVSDYIVPMPQTSVTAAHILRANQIFPTLVHVDAAHEYEEVLRDCVEYFDLLVPGGYLIGDDYDMGWPGVIRAVGEFSAKTMRPLAIEVPKWIIRK
jgi:predicted O-methyltransferase YrrM